MLFTELLSKRILRKLIAPIAALLLVLSGEISFAQTTPTSKGTSKKQQTNDKGKPSTNNTAPSRTATPNTGQAPATPLPAAAPAQTAPAQAASQAPVSTGGGKPVLTTTPTFQAATRLPTNATVRPKSILTFKEEETALETTTGTLRGTLCIPANASTTASVPFVLLVNTNTVVNRDGFSHNNQDSSMHLKYLAQALAKHGIASLRYDTRGVGKSYLALKDGEAALSFEKTITDIAGWATQARKDKRFSTLTILGAALPMDYGREAALASVIAANRVGADGFIGIAPDSRRYTTMIRQKVHMTFIAPTSTYIDSLTQLVEAGKRFELDKKSSGAAYNLFRPTILKYVFELNAYEPRTEFGKLQVPGVILHGTGDLSLPADAVFPCADANPLLQGVSIKNMSFMLKDSNLDATLTGLQKHKAPVLEDVVRLCTDYIFSVNIKQ
ncbi:MAG: hypothetical protein EAZ92_15405 [Candidatus Kapaibacterium sp.]|nr:MAG: hypothetical protein EAZ92_15405 [Candidatus Kapabacteria bacterium]